jgi:hypothetical protein
LRLPRNRGDRRRFFPAPRESHYSARIVCARLISQSKVVAFEHLAQIARFIGSFQKPDHSVALLVKVRTASSSFGRFDELGVLTPVNSDDQAASMTKPRARQLRSTKRTDAVPAAKFETAETPGSQVLPELALLVS